MMNREVSEGDVMVFICTSHMFSGFPGSVPKPIDACASEHSPV